MYAMKWNNIITLFIVITLVFSCSEKDKIQLIIKDAFMNDFNPSKKIEMGGVDYSVIYLGSTETIKLSNWDISDASDRDWLIKSYGERCSGREWDGIYEYRDKKNLTPSLNAYLLMEKNVYCLIINKL